MADFNLSLDIKTTGDKEAVAKLNAVNAATKQSATTHDVTAKKADEHRLALGKLGRALENYVEQTTGANHVIGELANTMGDFALGAAPMIAILGGIFAVTKAYELLTARSKEAQQAQLALAQSFERIAAMDVAGQGAEAARLFNGNPNAADPLDRFGIRGLTQQQADLERRVRAGTITVRDINGGGMRTVMSEDAAQAADLLEKVKRKLQEITPLYRSIVGAGGSMEQAGTRAASLVMSIQADAMGKVIAPKASPAGQDAAAKDLARDMAAAAKLNTQQQVGTIIENDAIRKSIFGDLIPTKEQIDSAVKEASDHLRDALEHDPILAFHEAVMQLAAQMKMALADIVGRGLSEGFEAAFSGKGIGEAFKSLTASVLAGLGGFMEALGAQMIVIGVGLEAFATAVKSLNGIAAVAAGVALVAAGAGLKAIAGSFGSDHMAGSSYGGSYSGSGLSQIIDRGVINPDSYSARSASSIPARPQVNASFTVIGPNDPNAVRGIDEILRRINQRGSLAGAAA